MILMRNLTSTHRLQALSVPEITEEFERLATEYARTHRFRGGKLRQGHVLNAAVLHFLGLPDEERTAVVARGLAELEAILDDDAPADTLPAATIDVPVTKAAGTTTRDEKTDRRSTSKRTG